jgi:hypothetical protein
MIKYLKNINSPFTVYTTIELFDITTKARMKIIVYNDTRSYINCSSKDFRDDVHDWSWEKSRYVSTKSLAMVLAHHYSIVDLVENRKNFHFRNKSHHYMKPVKWNSSSAEVRLGLMARYELYKNKTLKNKTLKNKTLKNKYNKPL